MGVAQWIFVPETRDASVEAMRAWCPRGARVEVASWSVAEALPRWATLFEVTPAGATGAALTPRPDDVHFAVRVLVAADEGRSAWEVAVAAEVDRSGGLAVTRDGLGEQVLIDGVPVLCEARAGCDLGAFAALPALRGLSLRRSAALADVSALDGHPALTSLHLDGTRVSELGAAAPLGSLEVPARADVARRLRRWTERSLRAHTLLQGRVDGALTLVRTVTHLQWGVKRTVVREQRHVKTEDRPLYGNPWPGEIPTVDPWAEALFEKDPDSGSETHFVFDTERRVRPCRRCEGKKKVDCAVCSGKGRVPCDRCQSRRVECATCNGTGRPKGSLGMRGCADCSGKGWNPCDACEVGTLLCAPCRGEKREECPECKGRGRVCTLEVVYGARACDVSWEARYDDAVGRALVIRATRFEEGVGDARRDDVTACFLLGQGPVPEGRSAPVAELATFGLAPAEASRARSGDTWVLEATAGAWGGLAVTPARAATAELAATLDALRGERASQVGRVVRAALVVGARAWHEAEWSWEGRRFSTWLGPDEALFFTGANPHAAAAAALVHNAQAHVLAGDASSALAAFARYAEAQPQRPPAWREVLGLADALVATARASADLTALVDAVEAVAASRPWSPDDADAARCVARCAEARGALFACWIDEAGERVRAQGYKRPDDAAAALAHAGVLAARVPLTDESLAPLLVAVAGAPSGWSTSERCARVLGVAEREVLANAGATEAHTLKALRERVASSRAKLAARRAQWARARVVPAAVIAACAACFAGAYALRSRTLRSEAVAPAADAGVRAEPVAASDASAPAAPGVAVAAGDRLESGQAVWRAQGDRWIVARVVRVHHNGEVTVRADGEEPQRVARARLRR